MVFENRQRFANDRFCMPFPRTRSMTKESRQISGTFEAIKISKYCRQGPKIHKMPYFFLARR